jgi:hypothetical protein
VWARYSCFESTLIVFELIVNTHVAEVFSFEYLRGMDSAEYVWVRYS